MPFYTGIKIFSLHFKPLCFLVGFFTCHQLLRSFLDALFCRSSTREPFRRLVFEQLNAF